MLCVLSVRVLTLDTCDILAVFDDEQPESSVLGDWCCVAFSGWVGMSSGVL